MNTAKRFWHYAAARPFRSSVIVMIVALIPVFWRIQYAIDEAHDAANEAKRAVAQLAIDRDERRHELCLRDVADRKDDRAMWLEAFDLFPTSDEVVQLRVTLDNRLPLLECDEEDIPTPIGGS